MDTILEEPQAKQPPIIVPPGRLEAPIDNNLHRVVRHHFDINGQTRNVEMIHQIRSGDCVLANFVNTESLEHAISNNTDAELLMTIQEARQAAVNFRRRVGQDSSDIEQRDSPLE